MLTETQEKISDDSTVSTSQETIPTETSINNQETVKDENGKVNNETSETLSDILGKEFAILPKARQEELLKKINDWTNGKVGKELLHIPKELRSKEAIQELLNSKRLLAEMKAQSTPKNQQNEVKDILDRQLQGEEITKQEQKILENFCSELNLDDTGKTFVNKLMGLLDNRYGKREEIEKINNTSQMKEFQQNVDREVEFKNSLSPEIQSMIDNYYQSEMDNYIKQGYDYEKAKIMAFSDDVYKVYRNITSVINKINPELSKQILSKKQSEIESKKNANLGMPTKSVNTSSNPKTTVDVTREMKFKLNQILGK